MELEERSLYLRLGAPVPGLDQAGHGHEEPHDRHVDTAWPGLSASHKLVYMCLVKRRDFNMAARDHLSKILY